MSSSYTHNTGTFIGKGGVEIYFQTWTVASPKAILIIGHGLGEHSGRYQNLIDQLDGKKISIFALDFRGHGHSSGKKGHVDSFMDFVYDLKLFIDLIKQKNEKVPAILFGHSMGGVVSTKYALTFPDDIQSLILSSPGFLPTVEPPQWKKKLAHIFTKTYSRLTLSSGLPASGLSHDSDVVEAYENDNLVHDRISAKLYSEFMKNCEECLNRSSELHMPLLVFHGTGDPIADYNGSERFYENISSKFKDIFLFEGLYHETINEILEERGKVLKIITDWVEKITGKKQAAPKKTETAVSTNETEAKPVVKAASKTTKKSAKKTTKKSTKKVTKKAAKKAAKKTAKKVAKKTTKKTTKKTSKKKK